MEELKKHFFTERNNIDTFFKFIMQSDFLNIYAKIKKLSFKQVLDHFFNDYRLKATLNVLLRNIGLSANQASALAAIILFREYILDPGYYPLF